MCQSRNGHLGHRAADQQFQGLAPYRIVAVRRTLKSQFRACRCLPLLCPDVLLLSTPRRRRPRLAGRTLGGHPARRRPRQAHRPEDQKDRCGPACARLLHLRVLPGPPRPGPPPPLGRCERPTLRRGGRRRGVQAHELVSSGQAHPAPRPYRLDSGRFVCVDLRPNVRSERQILAA